MKFPLRKSVLQAVLGIGGSLALSGCALQPPESGATIHVADIINSVKCGLAEALQSEAGRRRLAGTIATVELQLKVVDTRSFGASSPSLTGPVILGWYGPMVLPTLSGSNQQSFTVDTTINLTYRLDAPSVSACTAEGVDPRDKFGFARWLGDVITGLSKVTPRGPKGTLDRLTYDSLFAVTREGSGGASVRVVFIDAGVNISRSRADTQRLKIVISGANGVATTIEGVPILRGSLSNQGDRPPNLSSSAPAAR